ncbi:MAG: hypothetical protein SWY16_08210 [Cyanobacteriota bacterium]|nr:hypothetical protein [Cyanobacteriota bacterium]
MKLVVAVVGITIWQQRRNKQPGKPIRTAIDRGPRHSSFQATAI